MFRVRAVAFINRIIIAVNKKLFARERMTM